MAPPCKYDNAEDRIKACRAQKNDYSKKQWFCEICRCEMKLGNKTNHLSSQKHYNNRNGIYTMVREDKLWNCEICDIEIHVHSKDNHLKTSRHIRNTNKDNLKNTLDELEMTINQDFEKYGDFSTENTK